MPANQFAVTPFVDEYERVSAWTGETVEELKAQEDYHSGDRELWLSWAPDGTVNGVMHPWLRPDGKLTLYYDKTAPEAFVPLAEAVPGEVYTMVGEADAAVFLAAGFEVTRRQLELRLPVTTFDAPLPAGIEVLSAADVPLEPLMRLDCALREDVPGAHGWQPDPVWFREETYDSPFFDPSTYLVARHGTDYVGICRVWNGPAPHPRLGLIAVLPAYSGRGLAKALLAKVFAVLHARGIEWIESDADEVNDGSLALQQGLGATVRSVHVELRRSGLAG